jgi:hypothetical protein
MLRLVGFNQYPIMGLHMPSYEIKTKQLNYHDLSKLIVINTKARAFIFDLRIGKAVKVEICLLIY